MAGAGAGPVAEGAAERGRGSEAAGEGDFGQAGFGVAHHGHRFLQAEVVQVFPEAEAEGLAEAGTAIKEAISKLAA